VRLSYSILVGTLTSLNADLELASDQDFRAGEFYMDILDGERSGEINLTIYDDSLPEVQEVFLVNLTG